MLINVFIFIFSRLDENQNNRRMVYSNTAAEFNPNQTSVDNPEYHLMSDDQKLGIPRVRFGQQKSSEEESDRSYSYYLIRKRPSSATVEQQKLRDKAKAPG